MSSEPRTVCARVKSSIVVASPSNGAASASTATGAGWLGKMLRCTVAKAPVDFCSAAEAYATTRSRKPTAPAKSTVLLEVPSGGAPPQVPAKEIHTREAPAADRSKVGNEPRYLLPMESASESRCSTWVFSSSPRASSRPWASASDFSSSATRFVMPSLSPADQRSNVINKPSRSNTQAQGLVLTVRFLQSSAESIPLLFHSHEGCGSFH